MGLGRHTGIVRAGLDKSRAKCSQGYIVRKFLHAAAALPLLVAGAGAAAKSGHSLARPVPASLLRELSTDRPDQTESPYTVDAGRFQVELDFVHHASRRDTSGGGSVRTRNWRIAPVNLKVGLLDRVDLQLLVDPLVNSRVEDRIAGTTEEVSGFGDVTTRLKVNFWGNDGGSTAFAIMPFVKWPLPASGVRNGATEGGVIFILGFQLPGGWSSAAMTELDIVSDGAGGRDTEWVNSITFAHDLTDRLGGYLELVAVTGDAPGFKWQGQFDAGLTYALDDNTQLDLGCNFGVTDSAPDYQPFAGLSRRF
ncbi:MAG: transporter [Opitutae bacterium]|nr:transporter [Opitutae bacterium]